MKKFKFRYKALLAQKKNHVERLSIEVSSCKRGIKNILEILEKIQERRRRIVERLKHAQSESGSINDIKHCDGYISSLDENILEQRARLKELSDSLECMRSKLISAQKEMKMVEKIKENDLNEFVTNLNKNEAKAIDEIAVIRANKKNGAEI